MSEVRTIEVRSASRPGLVHTVTITDGEKTDCTDCEAWYYRGVCPHGPQGGQAASRPQRSYGYAPSAPTRSYASRWEAFSTFVEGMRVRPVWTSIVAVWALGVTVQQKFEEWSERGPRWHG
jgi:hypothetical protein